MHCDLVLRRWCRWRYHWQWLRRWCWRWLLLLLLLCRAVVTRGTLLRCDPHSVSTSNLPYCTK
jgi:hypothetical protein